tara:strand:- start:293 stop:2299 length:2007 start_codon:yes stop_codon:yes gene_type:complete
MSCGCGCGGEVVAYEDWNETDVTAAEYQGRKVTLNKPFRTPGASKKFGVYTTNEKGNVVLVRFGDPNMEIKRDDPERRRNFRSRHNCDNPGPKYKARYWSCRQWESKRKVEAMDEPCGCNDVKANDCDCEGECLCGNYEAATPTPKSTETHSEYMSRCQEMGNSKDECMKAHEGHKFKDQDKAHKRQDHYRAEMEYDNPGEAMNQAKKMGCDKIHTMEMNGKTIYMPCESHEEFMSKRKGDVEVESYMKKKKKEDEDAYALHVHDHKEDPYKTRKIKYNAYDTKTSSCEPGFEKKDGRCQRIAVTIDLEIDELEAKVSAETGKIVYEIRGIAFHEGMNKNKWSLTPAGARSVVSQMEGADVTLMHPKANETGAGFTRSMDSIEESTVGNIVGATFFTTQAGYDVRYVARVTREELFASMEDGLWKEKGYGVSIGGSGVPIAASEDGFIFGEDFTFDHLALVKRPAYKRANVETIEKKKVKAETPTATEKSQTFIGHSSSHQNQPTVIAMTETENTEINFEDEMESVKAELVLANSRIAEYEAIEAQRVEDERMALVTKASDLGMSGHEDLSTPTLETLIASWEAAHPEPVPVEMTPVESVEKTVAEPAVASEDRPMVSNYLNGKMISNDEAVYSKAYNAWASAWNKTLAADERSRMTAHKYEAIKEMN